MKTTPVLILAVDDGWAVFWERAVGKEISAALGEEPFLPDVAAVVDAIQQHAEGRVGVVIGVASHRCFAARVPTDGLPPRQLRQALPFRFETAVPFAVEDLVLDVHGQGTERLVVATHFEPLQNFVHELEDADIQVFGIAPLALLAAQSADTTTEDAGDPPDPITVTIDEPAALCDAQVPSVSEVTIADRGVGDQFCTWRWQPGVSCEEGMESGVAETLRLALATTCRVIDEDERLWINLQQGPLASRHTLDRVRRPLTAVIAAAALLLLALIGAMQVRAWQYQNIAARHDDQARGLYEDAFPGEAVPVSMERRLMTRVRELRGRQGLATPDAQLFAPENTLAILADLLARLPEDTRLVITDLRLSGDRIDLTGQARSHSDADTLAAALRDDGRFEVTPPSTENLPTQGVQFSLNLTPVLGDRATAPPEALASERVGAAPRRDEATLPRGDADGGTP